VFGNKDNLIWILIGVIVGLIIIFLICRELVCWYWKINKRITLMEEQNELLSNLIQRVTYCMY
jgi:hypothetical protein